MKRVITFVLGLWLFVASGCGMFQLDRIDHVNACGPVATKQILQRFNRYQSRENLSAKIRANALGEALRIILGFFDAEAHNISWPWEMEYILNEYGLEMNEYTGKPQKGLVLLYLVRDADEGATYHWGVYPNTYPWLKYGTSNKIVKIWRVQKISPST